jgi:hypothetical protein
MKSNHALKKKRISMANYQCNHFQGDKKAKRSDSKWKIEARSSDNSMLSQTYGLLKKCTSTLEFQAFTKITWKMMLFVKFLSKLKS